MNVSPSGRYNVIILNDRLMSETVQSEHSYFNQTTMSRNSSSHGLGTDDEELDSDLDMDTVDGLDGPCDSVTGRASHHGGTCITGSGVSGAHQHFKGERPFRNLGTRYIHTQVLTLTRRRRRDDALLALLAFTCAVNASTLLYTTCAVPLALLRLVSWACLCRS